MKRKRGHTPKRGLRLKRARDDRGAASIFVLALGLLMVAAGVAGSAVGNTRVARHRAHNAADLGALAGAMHAVYGERDACARAARFVAANRGRLTGCTVTGLEIVVRAEVDVRPLPGLLRRAEAVARAGPVYAVDATDGYPSDVQGGRYDAGLSAPITTSSTRTAPGLWSGLLPFPHLGDWTQDGHPFSQTHEEMASRVACNHSEAAS